MRALLLVAPLVLASCQCLSSVEECDAACEGAGGGSSGGGSSGGGTGGSSGGAGTGGGSVAARTDAGCAIWDGGGVGRCAAVTGYVFTGEQCLGACVFYPIETAGIFPNVKDCAMSCAEAGRCNLSKWKSNLPGPPPPLEPESSCDDVTARVPLPLSTAPLIEAIGGVDPGDCSTVPGNTDCMIWRHTLGDAGYLRACAATLVDGVESVTCNVFL